MEELFNKAKNGDKEAYDELVSELYKYLYTIAKDKLHDEDDIKDAVQETLIKFDANYKNIKETKALKKWARTVLINTCHDIYKSNKKIENLVEKLKENTDVTENDLDKIDIKDNSILKELNDKERTIILLRYFEDYTISQICNELGENENTVKSNLHRARCKLAEKADKKNGLSMLSIILAIVILVSSGITFGGRIINTLREKITMFQITTIKAIEDAISNDYVDKIDTEFVYDNDVGIKISEVAMDDKLLYISYNIKLDKDVEISDIELEKYSIIDNRDNVLSVEIDTDIKNRFGSDYSSGGVTYDTKPVKYEDGNWVYRTTFQVMYDKDYPTSELLNINIERISVLTNSGREYFEGNWSFKVNLSDKLLNRTSTIYTYEENAKIKNISAKLNDLSLELVIEFNENINEDVATSNNIILQDENGELINLYSKVVNVYKNKVTYICDIGKYSKDINRLSLYMKYNYGVDKFVDVVLER